MVDQYRVDSTRAGCPVPPELDFVAQPPEIISHVGANSSFHAEASWEKGVWPERIRETLANDSWLLDGLLRVHPEVDDVQEDLGHRLGLPVATGRPKDHCQAPLTEGEGWIGG